MPSVNTTWLTRSTPDTTSESKVLPIERRPPATTAFGLAASDHGVGFTLEQLAAFPAISRELLVGYLAAVQHDTRAFLQAFPTEELDVVPGRIPFPPNIPRGAEVWSVGRMFRQLFGELNQHLGQVRYLRGIIKGSNR